MSLQDQQDFEYPPGLGSMRNRGGDSVDRDQQQQRYVNEQAYERKLSMGISNYGGLPRVLGLDRDIGYGVVPETMGQQQPNRNNANGSLSSNALLSRSSYSLSSNTNTNGSNLNNLNNNANSNIQRNSSAPSSSPPAIGNLYNSASPSDQQLYRPHTQAPTPPTSNIARSTLWWGEIEPWMDEEYVKQVCNLMGWDPVSIKVPHPGPDQQANNLGYCFLTFPSPSHAAAVLSQIQNAQKSGAAVTMPNSSKPFVLNWATNIATSLTSAAPVSSFHVTNNNNSNNNNNNSFQGQDSVGYQPQQYQKEYSIFVGDLAPETSNSDLVAVFRNPVLGLRNDREPKFIRPFLSCKSAKIMLDPVTGVSRGYGFVRFTDEADQQRALIEMHGLYCLSRPMRISPATAKFKPPPSLPPQIPFSPTNEQPVSIALPLPNTHHTKSVSAPIAATSNGSLTSSGQNGNMSMSGSSTSIGASSSNGALTGNNSSSSISSGAYGQLPTSLSADDLLTLPNHVLQQIAQQYANSDAGAKFAASVGSTSSMASSSSSPYVDNSGLGQSLSRLNGNAEGGVPPRYTINEESWKHHTQARAILGNLIGPNGEQLTSTDPYNTTVFVGGLSPLISEETLRTFFAPFGDIHYVKVPVGKHCGFVQFVRKADAERAIEKMQGFPVGGSRIRLSWGRSQYKAAQAAAQAAQTAALQSQQYTLPPMPTLPPLPPLLPVSNNSLTQEQAIQLLQRIGYLGGDNHINDINNMSTAEQISNAIYGTSSSLNLADTFAAYTMQQHPSDLRSQGSAFSPFSAEGHANGVGVGGLFQVAEMRRRDSAPVLRPEPFTQQYQHSSKYSGAFTLQTHDLKGSANNGSKPSPTSTRPPSATRYPFLDTVAPASRPPSGHQRNGSIQHHYGEEGQGYDALHDLNGTLASLDLDRDRPSTGIANAQFRRTPSPRG